MSFTNTIGVVLGFLVFIYILSKIIDRLSKKRRVHKLKKLYLSKKVKIKANEKFNKLLHKFKQQRKKKPNKDELFRIIINASHITIRRKGGKGHWGRQKIRKYL
jgi:hypothetical protein